MAASCLHPAIITNDEQSCSGCGVTITQPAGTIFGVSKAGANATAHALACLGINTVCGGGFTSNSPQTCTVDCPGGPQSYTMPAGTFTAPTLAQANQIAYNAACANAAVCGGGEFNAAQSCTIFCPQTNANITATVEAGILFGLTIEAANAAAHGVACLLAFLACQAMPPLISNEPQTCEQLCNGQSVTYTVPLGAFVSYDQSSANAIAILFACQVLSTACQQDDLPPAQAGVGNSLQNCSVPCPGGSGSFTSSVPRGTFFLENLAAANAAAQSYCQSLAQSALFCFPNITSRVCLESVYAASVTPTGLGTLSRITVLVAGALPPGIFFADGLIFGTPNVAGVYDFRFAAVDTEGNTALRDYTLTVAGITTDTFPDGVVGTAYNQVLAQIGFSDPGFFVVGGSLPAGLSLNASSGAIFGTPTTAGTSNFVVQIEDVDGSCTKDLSITVTGPVLSPTVWWPLDEAGNVSRFDSIAGVELFVAQDPVTSAAGKVSLASQHVPLSPLGAGELLTNAEPALAYQGAGFDAFGWINPVTVTGYGTVLYTNGFTGDDIFSVNMEPATGFIRIFVQGDGLNNETILLPFPYTPGTWVFWRVFFDATTQKFGVQLNNGAITNSAFRPLAASTFGALMLNAPGAPGLGNYLFDETGLFLSGHLSDADASTIYNSGLGRTFP